MSAALPADQIAGNSFSAPAEEKREHSVTNQVEPEQKQDEDGNLVIVSDDSLDEPPKSPINLCISGVDAALDYSDRPDRCTCLCHTLSNIERIELLILPCEACIEEIDHGSCPSLDAESNDKEDDTSEPTTPTMNATAEETTTRFLPAVLGEFPTYYWWGMEDLLEAEGLNIQVPWEVLSEDLSEFE